MSKYLVIPRRADSPMTHAGGSTEETVCEIAKNLLHYPGPSEYLMAIPLKHKQVEVIDMDTSDDAPL